MQELLVANPCNGAILNARRNYQPASWVDGEVSFAAGALKFTVPDLLSVSAGAAAHGKAKLTFSTGGGTPVVCVYRGDGGTKYLFRKCKQGAAATPDLDDQDVDHDDDDPGDPLPTAGSTASADSFTLHVNRGDKKAGSTVVQLTFAGPVVDDGNVCTNDACDSAGQVTHTPVPAGTVVAGCSDNNACNGAEVCDGAGSCAPGALPVIDDGNPCTADACDPLIGVTHTALAAGTSCSDGNACDGAETCDGAGRCNAGTALALDDGNECTADACDPVSGVTHTAIDSSFCRGKANFHDRSLAGLGGNGRSCADCHMDSQNFQLTPAAALARFTAMTSTGVDDPLFRPIDADDFR
ncbi:MAG TPA: hypothetical protein VKJ07_19930, partial [Mycobacteriales bacterium]|nr:hypothetical protein [Mycobacteriales bacterium]